MAGLDADQPGADRLAGAGGTMIYCVDDLDRLLTGVYLDLLTVSLDAGAQFVPAAAMLQALWNRRGIAADAAKGAFNADPLGTLARTGSLPVSRNAALAQLADLARHTAAASPNVTAVGVDTSPYHDAGATESQDLAISMATALAYVKAMTASGLGIDAACRQILFTYSLPCDQFLAICKLRAARKMWARVAEACGASEPARAMRLNTVTAWRMMSKRDPWVNMLRTTVACFSGGGWRRRLDHHPPVRCDPRSAGRTRPARRAQHPRHSRRGVRTWRRSSIRRAVPGTWRAARMIWPSWPGRSSRPSSKPAVSLPRCKTAAWPRRSPMRMRSGSGRWPSAMTRSPE